MKVDELAKRLLQVDYLTSYDDSGSIKEYDRTLRKTVDQPAILCRVKSASNSKAPEKKQLLISVDSSFTFRLDE